MAGRRLRADVRPGALGDGNPAQYDYDTIAAYLQGANPDLLAAAERAYAQAKSALEKAEIGLAQHVKRLHSVWQGDAQELGTADVRRLNQASRQLAGASEQFSRAMGDAYVTVKTSQRMPNKTTPLGVLTHTDPIAAQATKTADDKLAQQHLAKTNAALGSAFNQIPSSLTIELPTGAEGGTPFGGGEGEGGSGGPTGGGGRLNSSPAPSSGAQMPTAGKGGGSHLPGHESQSPNSLTPTGASLPAPGHGHGSLAAPAPSDLERVQPDIPGGSGGTPPPPGLSGPNPADGGGPNQRAPIPRIDAPLPTVGKISPMTEVSRPTAIPSPPQRGPGGPSFTPLGGSSDGIRPGGVLGAPNGGTVGSGLGGRPAGGPGHSKMSGGVIRSGAEITRQGTNRTAGSMPMGRGSIAGRKSENERESWLYDDEDLWTDEVNVAPRVLGELG